MIKKAAKWFFLLLAPLLLALLGITLALHDVICRLRWRRKAHKSAGPESGPATPPRLDAPPHPASIVIPNWNGKDLLEKYLPTVLAACQPSDEIIVVDNASTDGSAEFVGQHFPQVRLLKMDRNLGFGGGANAGIRAARYPIAVLLNNDMRATPDFLAPLLEGFTDPDVFAVSAQIFFSDRNRRREETGLTTGRFEKGFLRVCHEADGHIQRLFPTFYAGGGSTAYDREKFVDLGGFDPLFEPFYLEDTDLSYGAWRRGWKVLYQPRSCLFHEHRATIGRHYSPEAIRAYLQKNYVLMVWKNIHRWRWLPAHFFYLYGHMILACLGRATETRTTVGAFLLALRQFPLALRARRTALLRSRIDDPAVFERTRPSLFREAFAAGAQANKTREPSSPAGRDSFARATSPRAAPRNGRLNILFVSPYSINPPLHGGAVFMLQGIRELAKRHNIFVLTFVDRPEEAESNRALEGFVRKVEVCQRRHRPNQPFHLRSAAQRTFYDPQFAELLDKMVFLYEIDLIQFEYTQLAQYHLPLRTVPQCLFEHDIYFRSVERQLLSGNGNLLAKAHEFLEWLRALRYEIAAASKFDAVFACHEQEGRLLQSYLGHRGPKIYAGLRVAVDVGSYNYPGGPRQPDSLLFVGNFQHRPNAQGLAYFCEQIFPLIRARRPQATLSIVGANVPPHWEQRYAGEGIRLVGQVPDIREPLSTHGVFVCPIRTGAGVRVKILEAFASGIPVVSTALGGEGLAASSGKELLLADSPSEFTDACLSLLEQPPLAQSIAANARRLVETTYDWAVVASQLDQIYRGLVARRTNPGTRVGSAEAARA